MPKSLADQYAISVAFARKINQRMDRLKALMEEQVKANGGKPLIGTDHEVALVVSQRTTLSTSKARTFLTRNEIMQCENTSNVRNWVVSERIDEQKQPMREAA